MPREPLPIVDTRPLFRPLMADVTRLLRTLDDAQWRAPAVGQWRVRDVVAHMTDTALRRLSFQRDRYPVPPPPHPLRTPADLLTRSVIV